ncbi:extracellular solute-binding domain protein [Brachybacterium faecium]|uniref:ABC-type sugar transport system, periplasmic component n=1 Tax=Brachybacterium faecium (strain ATCC 43885 / DSM 4810 / JCM 11609 / LMG 19847 / NBRC 14762 / NCIMB 9860 / 6-10) TaxID=446465 RepID=C7MA64_BRAFD|nr:extracellular solute-binding protein [Brachybacterium faecium]ACU86734.1 ABC-type sugar transport system, periplasmic component [Brachybacterium faecium DSM 4810]SLN04266.1 extracellular solute-binding domain protein [Brachybacterium faecium]
MLTRRSALSLGIAVPGLTALAACGPNAAGGSGGSGGEDGSASLRLAWWGNPTRDENTQNVVDAYEEVEPDVSISLEPGEWSGYWDKLATQTAGGDFPDIVQMDEKYLAEYGERGALLDLADAGLDTSDFAPGSVETGELPDVGLAAITAGLNALAFLINPVVFEEAGVDIPDDTTWTWDDLIDTAVKITENTPDGTYGMTQMGSVQGLFQVYVRQAGQDQYKDGEAGFDAETAAEWFEWAKKIQDTEAGPSASVSVEDSAQAMDQSLFATGKIGMTVAWSNQVVAHDGLVPEGVVVLRPPSMTGSAADAQLWYKASMYWSISARTPNPEAAVAFVDYLVNSPDAGKILSVERGVPGNLTVREAIVPDLDEPNMKAVDFLESVEDELGEAPEITPQGGGQFEDILTRACEDMLFGQTTTEEAGQRVLDDLASALG